MSLRWESRLLNYWIVARFRILLLLVYLRNRQPIQALVKMLTPISITNLRRTLQLIIQKIAGVTDQLSFWKLMIQLGFR